MISRAINWIILALTVLLCLMVLTDPAWAETRVGVHLWSEHSKDNYQITHEGGRNTERKFNEQNYGLYVTHNGWTVGTFENSYHRRTWYGGYTWARTVYGPVDAVAVAGLATGYRRVHGVGLLRPMIMPGLRISLPGGLDLRYSAVPAKGGAFQHLSVEMKFN